MAEVIDTQLVVLGAGPGGYAAAFLAADRGRKVTLIDAGERPGGTCLHVGCIPSKAVLHAAKLITDARDAEHTGLKFAPPQIDINGVRGHWQKVVDTLSRNLVGLAKARKVNVMRGIGGTAFTPIVNWPEVAILGLSRGRLEPVWRDGQFVPRLMLPLSLSYDHRVIDGADAARFLRWVAEAFEQPFILSL